MLVTDPESEEREMEVYPEPNVNNKLTSGTLRKLIVVIVLLLLFFMLSFNDEAQILVNSLPLINKKNIHSLPPLPPPPPPSIEEIILMETDKTLSSCGTWILKYANWHSEQMEILKKIHNGEKLPREQYPKFGAYKCRESNDIEPTGKDDDCGGLGDRFPGAVSTFIFTLQTGRVSLLDWPILHNTTHKPFFDWYYDPSWDDSKNWNMTWKFHDIVHCPDCIANPDRFKDYVEDIIMFRIARGITRYQNIQDKLASCGLSYKNAHGCILRFFFQPGKDIIKRFYKEYLNFKDPSILKIGIHIRDGDHSMLGGDKVDAKNFDRYDSFFQNANMIEQDIKNQNKTVKWFVVSDSSWIREEAVKKYGDKIWLTDVKPWHVSKVEALPSKTGHYQAKKQDRTPVQTMIDTLGEWWLYSQCDYFILTGLSGFSRTAYAYSLKEKAGVKGTDTSFKYLDITDFDTGSGIK